MSSTDNYLTAGKLVTFTHGEYSDYSMIRTFVALENVTFASVQALADRIIVKVENANEDDGWYDGDPQYEFLAVLLTKGWLLEVDNTERHIGSYGELELR